MAGRWGYVRQTERARFFITKGKGHPRDKRERGASAVEMALVAPLLILLLVGVMEMGLLFWNLSSLQTVVGAATRTAGTQSRIDGYHLQVKEIVEAGMRERSVEPLSLIIFRANPTTGRPTDLPAGDSNYSHCTAACWKFKWNPTTKQFDVVNGTTWTALEQKACGPSIANDFVGVWVSVHNSGIVTKNLKLHTDGIARLEPVPLSNGQKCQP